MLQHHPDRTSAEYLFVIGLLITPTSQGLEPPANPARFTAYSAAFLATKTIKIGTFNVAGTIIAVLTVADGITGLQPMGTEFFVTPIFQGGADSDASRPPIPT